MEYRELGRTGWKTMTKIDEIYERLVRPHVHPYW